MKILDRIALLRAGYNKAEIEAMINEEKELEAQQAAQPEEPEKAENEEPEAPEESEPDKPSEKESEIDYKALYEQEKAKTKVLQDENRKRDTKGNEPDPEAIVKDLVSSFI